MAIKNNINVGMLRFEKSNETLKIQLQFRTKLDKRLISNYKRI